MKFKLGAVAAAILASSTTFAAEEPTTKDLQEMLKKQQEQIDALTKEVKSNKDKAEQAEAQLEATAEAVESTMADAGQSRVSLGGYGELHYNNIEDEEEIDFHRFVLFIGYEFTDNIRFYSELEVEHALAGDGKPGEVEVEQAFVEFDLGQKTAAKAGLFLIPVGILNETHEPPTFYGVERNPVEKNILPATWWEGGAAITTRWSDGWSADFAIHSGLNTPTDGSNAFLIRSGRQKVAEANADSLAYTARVKYTGVPGLEVAASYQHQDDVTQGALGAAADLFTAHVAYQSSGFGIRALYAMWDIDGAEVQNAGRNEQEGYYIEPSYKFNEKWGIFYRFNAWDNNAGDAFDTEKEQSNFGLNYWPHPNVVLKMDIENRGGAQDGDGFNLGVGYNF